MFWLYLSCLIFGGVFVGLSVFSGLGDSDIDADKELDFDKDLDFDKEVDFDNDLDFDNEMDFDKEVDLDIDLDGDADKDIELDVEVDRRNQTGLAVVRRRPYRPFLSFKFYTFSLAFFGLTGVILGLFWGSFFGVLGSSILMGALAGFGITFTLHAADKGVGGHVASEHTYAGRTATVVLPITNQKAGKVKFQLKGRLVEMRAEAYDDDDEFILDFGEDCFVLEVENGVAKVVHPAQLETSDV